MLSLRALGSGAIDGRQLAQIVRKVGRSLKGAEKVRAARTILTKAAIARYLLLAGDIGSYDALKRRCGRFNRQLGDLLALAEINEDTLLWTAKGRKKLSELSGEEVRDLFYRPSRLEAHHIIKGSFMDKYQDRFKKLGNLIENSEDAFKRVDAKWWNAYGDMPAVALEGELHTVGPARLRDVFGVDLDMTKGFSKSFDEFVEARVAQGTGTLSELFDAHLHAYFSLMSPEWLSRRVAFGSGEFTLVEYLASRFELAQKAGL